MVQGRAALDYGIELFNAGEFFESHEVLEGYWVTLQGAERLFVQALIHYAVALHHHYRGNAAGAERQLHKGLRKLAGFLPWHADLETAAVYRDGQRWLEAVIHGQLIAAPKIPPRRNIA